MPWKRVDKSDEVAGYDGYYDRYDEEEFLRVVESTPACFTKGAFWTAVAAEMGRTQWGVMKYAYRYKVQAKLRRDELCVNCGVGKVRRKTLGLCAKCNELEDL